MVGHTVTGILEIRNFDDITKIEKRMMCMSTIYLNNIDELIAFSQREDKGTADNYLEVELASDIDFATDNDGEYHFYNWAGCTGTWYIHFNGNGHNIKNIYYNGIDNWGFFNSMYGEIKNLKLKEVHITSQSNRTGCICGEMKGGNDCIIENCHVSGKMVLGGQQCGGICGFASGNRISNCTFTGRIETSHDIGYVGGIAYVWGTNISTVYNCGVKADIVSTASTTRTQIHGIICNGIYNNNLPIHRCYFIGTLQRDTEGDVYPISNGSNCHECYAVVTSSKNAVVMFNPNVNNCFYDKNVAETAGYIVENGIGATTSQLQDISWLQQQGWSV